MEYMKSVPVKESVTPSATVSMAAEHMALLSILAVGLLTHMERWNLAPSRSFCSRLLIMGLICFPMEVRAKVLFRNMANRRMNIRKRKS